MILHIKPNEETHSKEFSAIYELRINKAATYAVFMFSALLCSQLLFALSPAERPLLLICTLIAMILDIVGTLALLKSVSLLKLNRKELANLEQYLKLERCEYAKVIWRDNVPYVMTDTSILIKGINIPPENRKDAILEIELKQDTKDGLHIEYKTCS